MIVTVELFLSSGTLIINNPLTYLTHLILIDTYAGRITKCNI